MKQFERFELLVGNKISKLSDKCILILGLGGVGSYAIEALARSGIKTFILVDNDIIDITNLNRQLMTNLDNIGKYKTDEIEKRILNINDKANITKINKFITKDNIVELFNYKIDYIVDACDTISVKLELIKECKERNIKLISSMGTGNKMDPSRLKIIDIRKTKYDPIAKKVRKFVKDERIKGKVYVVCSDEENYTKSSKTIPSNSFVPACAGLLCASYIVNDIVGDKFD